MIFKSPKTAKGNIGVSCVSAEKAVEQAEEMDNNGCINCYNCSRCSRCFDCSDCLDCSRCSGCSRCLDCSGCSDCSDCSRCSRCLDCFGFVNCEPASTPEQSIENLDKVRAIILDDQARLEMGHWHASDDWKDKTCAEEAVCGTTHCLAGWLQVCATDPEIRAERPETAGAMQAPIAAKMFFRQPEEVLEWLTNRTYVKELGVVEANPNT